MAECKRPGVNSELKPMNKLCIAEGLAIIVLEGSNPSALYSFGVLRQLNRKADDMRRIEGNTFRTVRCKMRPAPSNLPPCPDVGGPLHPPHTTNWRLEQGGFPFHAAPGESGNPRIPL